jgi:hypothetical protein
VDITTRANPLCIGTDGGDVVSNECFGELEVVHGPIVRR